MAGRRSTRGSRFQAGPSPTCATPLPIDDYDINGVLNGEFTLTGNYLTPNGSGRMEMLNAVFYGEPVDSATSTVRLEGSGARLQNIDIAKGGGRGTGNAYNRLGRDVLVLLRRTEHRRGVDRREQDDRPADFGAAQLHGRRQRIVRRAALTRSRAS
jgi:hypothetical protein